MSKAKDAIAELRNKMFDNKKQEIVEKAEETINQELDKDILTVIQNPNEKGYLGVKIQFNVNTKQARVAEVIDFKDKVVALSIINNKENLKYLFEKNRGKNENK